MNLPSARKRHKKFTEEGRGHEKQRGRAEGAEWRKQEEEDFKTEFDVACSKELAS